MTTTSIEPDPPSAGDQGSGAAAGGSGSIVADDRSPAIDNPDPTGHGTGPARSPQPNADLETEPDRLGSPAGGLDPTEPARSGPLPSPSPGLIVASLLSLLVFGFFNWPNPNSLSDLGQPLLFINTTPAGGDMGAHVWGPAYLRDNLLPQLQLTGWTPDWYAGFPAYHFYMVVPPLAIIALNAGLPWFLGLPLALAIGGGAIWAHRNDRFPKALPRPLVWGLVVLAAVLAVGMPYGVAFKLVSVSGLVAFPLAAWAMGRLLDLDEPIPAMLALASFIFIFDTNFTIYGGNIASTLAGEFSFSISLSLCLLAIGLVARGMERGNGRTRAALIIAAVALCHVLPVFFMMVGLGLLVLADRKVNPAWVVAGTVALALLPITFADGTGWGIRSLAIGAALVVLISAMAAEKAIFGQAWWLLVTGPVAILLSAFWLGPFALRHEYFNDMGWETIDHVGPLLLTVPMKVALPVAAVGAILSFASGNRLGMMFAGTTVIFASAVANVGQGPVWNARLLPFYYLSVYMLAGIALALVLRYAGSLHSGDLDRPHRWITVGGTALATVAVLVAVAMPLRILPGGATDGSGSYRWLAFSNTARSFLPGWAQWNYSGYERKDAYREYRQVVATMDEVGRTEGCGRAMWEHHADLNRYGTPMALMLLPHWTDGCIGSMEGLYFESSASTPFHFLNQSVLSDEPSNPQRNLPYKSFDIDIGVAQLQTTGVRYYMAQSDRAIAAAQGHPDLEQVAEAQPFVIFEVAGSDLVEGLEVEPVVVTGRSAEEVGDTEVVHRFDVGWESQAVTFYNNPNAFAMLPAEDGPDEWAVTQSLAGAPVEATETVAVSQITTDNDSVSFTVDRTGSPVLVKVSYFPNWSVDGAEGPWRVGPNMMAVIPTAEQVTLSYGRGPIDYLAILATLCGLALLAVLSRFDRGLDPVMRRVVFASAVPGSVPGSVLDSGPDGADTDDLDALLHGPDPLDEPSRSGDTVGVPAPVDVAGAPVEGHLDDGVAAEVGPMPAAAPASDGPDDADPEGDEQAPTGPPKPEAS